MKKTQSSHHLVAVLLSGALFAPSLFADGLSPAQLEDEYRNLYAEGSLPFVHSPTWYAMSDRHAAEWTAERRAEFDNLHAEAGLPFVHDPAWNIASDARPLAWTEVRLDEFRNLQAEGRLPFVHAPDALTSGVSTPGALGGEALAAQFTGDPAESSMP
jgi:hypothetical protein